MNPTPDRPDERLTAAASRALARARNGTDGDAVNELIRSVREAGESEDFARDLVLTLFAGCSEMVAALGSGGADPVKMQVMDTEGNEVSIDDAEPSVRTAVRVLLAEVHGDEEAASEQVEIALHNASPTEIASVLLQALRWTLRLAAECAQRALPVPVWIIEALED